MKQIKSILRKLSEDEINKLLDIMDIGVMNDEGSIDKEEKILIISTEPYEKIKQALEILLKNELLEKV